MQFTVRQKRDETWGKGEYPWPELPFGLLKLGTTTRYLCGKPGGAPIGIIVNLSGPWPPGRYSIRSGSGFPGEGPEPILPCARNAEGKPGMRNKG